MQQIKSYPYQNGMITIPAFCALTGRSKSNVYEQIKKGRSLDDIAFGIVPKRHTNNRKPVTYFWKGCQRTVSEIAKMEDIDLANLYRKLKNNSDITLVVDTIKDKQTKLFPYQGVMMSRKAILRLNPDVSKQKLYMLLRDDEDYTEEEVLNILALCPKKEYLQYDKNERLPD